MGAERRPEDEIQSKGRKDNAARPLDDARETPGAERYPSVNRDDSVNPGRARRTSPGPDNPEPRQGAGDGR